MRLGGTYNLLASDDGSQIYVGLNAGPPGVDESFGEVVFVVAEAMRPMWRLSCAMAPSLMACTATTPGGGPTGAAPATARSVVVDSADGAATRMCRRPLTLGLRAIRPRRGRSQRSSSR